MPIGDGTVYGKMQGTGRSVLDEARDRIRVCFENADTLVVCFSGGKDSTVVLNLTLEIAEEMNRLPVKVFFCDEEIIPPETVDYAKRVYDDPRTDMLWSCVPAKFRNGCSRRSPWYWSWDPEHEDLWVRERPEFALTRETHPDIPPVGLAEQIGHFLKPDLGTVVQLLGRRSQESLTRWRMIANRSHANAFMSRTAMTEFRHIRTADPIYDWTTEDVWLAPHKFGWDYNPIYDLMTKWGIALASQRVAPPFAEEPAKDMQLWAEGWPELWDKMVDRVPGAAAAYRYYNTPLYRPKPSDLSPAEGETWPQYVKRLTLLWPKETRREVIANIEKVVRYQEVKTKKKLGASRPMPDVEPDIVTGLSWRKVAHMVFRGKLRGRTLAMMLGSTER